MTSILRVAAVVVATSSVLFGAAAQRQAPAAQPQQTALDRYVAAPDANFSWKVARELPAEGVTATLLEMTSQRWLTDKEVEKPLWTHWITVVRPAEITSDVALLFISGGSNDRQPPARPPQWLVDAARETGTVTAELRLVPNQPVVFTDDPARTPRSEDDFIAYTWDKYLRTGDEKWPARLPMTKSAVRAMDAVTAFAATAPGGSKPVSRFVVSGASKRGWTAWTTAATDRRVIAVVPVVIDMLNVEPSFEHHWRAYGAWSDAVDDYVRHGIMDWLGTPQFRALMRIEEPYRVSRAPDDAQVHRERVWRPVLPPGLVAFLLRRARRGEAAPLRPQYVAFAREERRARRPAGVLRLDRQGHATSKVHVDIRTRRLDQGRDEGSARERSAVAGRQPGGA